MQQYIDILVWWWCAAAVSSALSVLYDEHTPKEERERALAPLTRAAAEYSAALQRKARLTLSFSVALSWEGRISQLILLSCCCCISTQQLLWILHVSDKKFHTFSKDSLVFWSKFFGFFGYLAHHGTQYQNGNPKREYPFHGAPFCPCNWRTFFWCAVC